ncbi:50S ribosomal protein L15 [bacterium]|nr:50S ribosomal protein L15 [bacterium]
MDLSTLKPAAGAVRSRKRRGRGNASGLGGTAGKGHKGHKARSGKNKGPGFEGGQMPLIRRIPKRGFVNPAHREYAVVNVGDLARFEAGAVVDVEALKDTRLVRKLHDGVKVLSGGELAVALTVRAHKFSAKAKEKIEAAGGKAEILG